MSQPVRLAKEACKKLEGLKLPGSCRVARLDLMDFDSVREFARKLRAEVGAGGLKLLVNNAGVMGVAMGADGEDHHLRANHLGPFLLTRLVIPAMAPASRIVNVSSRASFQGSIVFDKDGHIQLCNVLMTAELRRRLPAATDDASSSCQPGICVYAVCPGPVSTSLFRYFPWWMQWLKVLLLPLFKSPAQGAESSMFAATSPSLEGRSVLFITGSKAVEPPSPAQGAESSMFAATSPSLEGPSVLFITGSKAVEPLSPAQGADSSMFAATSPSFEGRSVLFITGSKAVEPPGSGAFVVVVVVVAKAQDKELSSRLWEESSRLVGFGSAEDEQQGYF
eukprot:gene12712-15954_t